MRRIVLIGIALAAALAVALPGCSRDKPASQSDSSQSENRNPQSTATRVKVVTAVRQLSTPQPAQVAAYEKTELYAKIAGYVQQLAPALGPDREPLRDKDGEPRPLDIGDRVEKGQLLVKLSVPELQKELELKRALREQAEADVMKYEADRVFREAELKRLELLVKDKSIREDVLDEKRLQRDAASAAIASARARVRVAEREADHVEAQFSYTSIKAPYNGVITRRLVDTWAFVQPGKEPLLTVARDDRLRIVTYLPEAEAALVKIGQPATFQVTVKANDRWPGKVVRFADALDSATRTMRTEIELDERPTDLRPNMFGSVTIGPIRLPKNALVAGAKKPAVVVVVQGKARFRDIELGLEQGEMVEVLRGLIGNEEVIIDGHAAVRDGEAVEIMR